MANRKLARARGASAECVGIQPAALQSLAVDARRPSPLLSRFKTAPEPPLPRMNNNEKRAYLYGLILIFCSGLSLLGSGFVFQVSEAREGSVIHALQLASGLGDFIWPLRERVFIPSKPPLFHWLASLLSPLPFSLEFELRIVSYLSAFLLLALCYRFEKRVSGEAHLPLSPLILLSSYGFIRLSADGRVDMLFVLLCYAALLTVWSGLTVSFSRDAQEPDPMSIGRLSSQIRTVAIATGFAVLAKGPAAYGIVGLAVLLAAIPICKDARHLRASASLLLVPQWLWALMIPLPWYLGASFYYGSPFVDRHIFLENLQRFAGASGIVAKPWWFYLEHLWTQFGFWMLPLCGIFLYQFAAFLIVRFPNLARFWPSDYVVTILAIRRSTDSSRALPAIVAWCFATFFLLSLSAGKRRAYLLILLPAVSLVVSLWLKPFFALLLRRAMVVRDFAAKARFLLLVVSTSILVCALLLSFVLLTSGALPESWQLPGVIRKAFSSSPWSFAFAGFLLPALLWLLAKSPSASPRMELVYTLQMLSLILIFQVSFWLSVKGVSHSYREFALELRRTLGEKGLSETKLVRSYGDESFDALLFYFQAPVGFDFNATHCPGASYCLQRSSKLPELKPGEIMLLSGGRRTDTVAERLVLTAPVSSRSTASGYSATSP